MEDHFLSFGGSVEKTATLLGVPRETVSKVISAYRNHGKRKSERKSNIDRNRSSYIEDYFEK
jgi:predicted transcriptional regulator